MEGSGSVPLTIGSGSRRPDRTVFFDNVQLLAQLFNKIERKIIYIAAIVVKKTNIPLSLLKYK
jgi:hypothetical protein